MKPARRFTGHEATELTEKKRNLRKRKIKTKQSRRVACFPNINETLLDKTIHDTILNLLRP